MICDLGYAGCIVGGAWIFEAQVKRRIASGPISKEIGVPASMRALYIFLDVRRRPKYKLFLSMRAVGRAVVVGGVGGVFRNVS